MNFKDHQNVLSTKPTLTLVPSGNKKTPNDNGNSMDSRRGNAIDCDVSLYGGKYAFRAH